MRLPCTWYLFLLLACSLVLTAQAQRPPGTDARVLPHTPGSFMVLGDLDIEHFSVEDGLPNNSIVSIAQDSLGFLWLGTSDGLSRYDGTSFQVYTNVPGDSTSLSYPRVEVVYVDPGGTLWVGTFGGGLNRFDPVTETFRRYLHDPGDPQSLISNHVMSLFEDAQGTFGVGTMGNVLHRMDREASIFERYVYDPAHPGSLSPPESTSLSPSCYGGGGDCGVIKFIDEDPSGVLWIGAYGGGLLRYDPVRDVLRRHEADPDDPQSLSNDQVWSIAEARDGTLWIGNLAVYPTDNYSSI